MPSSAAPIRLTPASISRAQPAAPSVTSATATASSPSAGARPDRSGASRPASIFSSLFSSVSAASKPKPSASNPSASAPSVASSSVSVSVSTSHPSPSPSSATTTTPSIAPSSSSHTTTTTTTTTPTSLPHPTTSSTAPTTTLPSLPSPTSTPHPSLPPSSSSPSEIALARSAVLASISNLVDRELTTRAALLHANNAAIEKQERDVVKATEALRKENEKLGKLADVHSKKVKEIGNVQNWAEMLEREFVILEETLRIVNDGEGGDSGGEGTGSGSEWSGSESDWEGEDGGEEGDSDRETRGGEREEDGREGAARERRDGEGDVVMGDGPETVPLPASPAGESVPKWGEAERGEMA